MKYKPKCKNCLFLTETEIFDIFFCPDHFNYLPNVKKLNRIVLLDSDGNTPQAVCSEDVFYFMFHDLRRYRNGLLLHAYEKGILAARKQNLIDKILCDYYFYYKMKNS